LHVLPGRIGPTQDGRHDNAFTITANICHLCVGGDHRRKVSAIHIPALATRTRHRNRGDVIGNFQDQMQLQRGRISRLGGEDLMDSGSVCLGFPGARRRCCASIAVTKITLLPPYSRLGQRLRLFASNLGQGFHASDVRPPANVAEPPRSASSRPPSSEIPARACQKVLAAKIGFGSLS
jgi:hypothetical protein